MICCAVIAITLPVFSSFVPQNKTETIGDPQLIEELLKENADASDGGVPGEYVEGAYQVVNVTGGNTLTVLWGDVQEKVKLIGVEPVESSEENLRKLLLSDLISLEFDAVDQDEDGHLLAYAYREDGVFINRELLALGYAKLADEPDYVDFSIATGVSAAPFFERLLEIARERFPDLKGHVYAIKNDFFGHSINVAGLVTGGDLINQLRGRELGERLFISQNMLRRLEQDFLDDVKLEEASAALGVPIYPTEADGFALCDAIFGILPELPEPVREQSGEKYYMYNQN